MDIVLIVRLSFARACDTRLTRVRRSDGGGGGGDGGHHCQHRR